MSSFAADLQRLRKVSGIAAEHGVTTETALELCEKMLKIHNDTLDIKREERRQWDEKRPQVAEFYRTNPNARIDPDDIAERVGLPKTRGNRTRIFRELRQLGWDRDAAKSAETL